jgi:hypothetical protein
MVMEVDMKRKRLYGGILGTLLAFFSLFTACEQPTALSSNASVSSVSVAGVRALSLGSPSMDWMQAVEDPGHVFIGRGSLSDALVEVQAASGAAVLLARARPNVQPDFVSNNIFSFESEDFLFVEAFSENLDTYTIYAIVVHSRNPGLLDLTLDGKSAMGGTTTEGRPIVSYGDLGTPAASPDAIPEENEGTISFDDAKSGTSLAVTLTPEVDSSYFRVTAAGPESAPVFTGPFAGAAGGVISGLSVTAVDGDYLYIEARGDGSYSDLSYYKMKMVARSNDRRLKTAKFVWYDGDTKVGEQTLGIGVMGTHSFSGGENYGNYDNGAEVVGGSGTSQAMPVNSSSIMTQYDDASGERPPANFRLTLELEGEDPDLQIDFDYTKNQRSQPQFVIPGVKNGGVGVGDYGKLIGFYWIAVEVTSPMGEKGWYKFGSRIGSENADIGSIKINGVALPELPGGNSSSADVSQGFVDYTLPANADMTAIRIEAAPLAGYYSVVSVVMAPDRYTDVTPVLFDMNEVESLDGATGINTTTLGLTPGQFVYIRVLAEISWLYGGSGFVSPTWNPARTDGYTAYKFYKVRILREGTNSDVEVSDITYKGASIGDLPAPITVSTSQNTTFTTDGKKNVITVTNTTTTWSADHAVYQTNDYDEAVFSATGSPGVRFAYGLASGPTAVIGTTDFTDSGRFGGLASNSYVVVRATSEDGLTVQYYRIHMLSPSGSDYAPAAIMINGENIDDIGEGNAGITGSTAVEYGLPNRAAFERVTVAVTPPNPYVNTEYALADAVNTNLDADSDNNGEIDVNYWTHTDGVFEYVNPAQYVYIRMISADRTATRYYKVRLMQTGASDDAALTDIRINGTSIGTVPAPNNAVTGTTAGLYQLTSLQNLNNLQVAVDASPGATVAYAAAVANNTNIGADGWGETTGIFGIFPNAQWLNIRVVSESGLTIRYYKVRLAAGNPEADIGDITINGASITGETPLPAANTAVTGTTSVVYHIPNAAALTNMTVAATGVSTGATVAYAGAEAANSNITAWTNTTGRFPSFTAGQWVYIRVISEDTVTTRYYKVRVAVGSDAAVITGITINSVAVSLPAPNTAVTGTTAETYTTSSLLNPLTAAVQGASTGATVTYAVAAAANTNTAAAAFTGTASITGFTSGQYLVIRVVSQDTITTNYYKVRVIHGNPNAALEGIRINNEYVIPLPPANNAANGVNAGSLEFPSDATLAPVTVNVGVSPGAAVAYASAAAANTNITGWTNTTGVFNTFTAGSYVAVRVISQDGQTTRYYKVRLTVTP